MTEQSRRELYRTTRPAPSWVYRRLPEYGCLDLTELRRLGAERPQWSNHFCTWEGFRRYVKGCVEGVRIPYGAWSTRAEWDAALAELRHAGRLPRKGG